MLFEEGGLEGRGGWTGDFTISDCKAFGFENCGIGGGWSSDVSKRLISVRCGTEGRGRTGRAGRSALSVSSERVVVFRAGNRGGNEGLEGLDTGAGDRSVIWGIAGEALTLVAGGFMSFNR